MHGLPRSKVFCSGYAVPGATFRRRPFINRKTSKIKRRFLVSFFVAKNSRIQAKGANTKERSYWIIQKNISISEEEHGTENFGIRRKSVQRRTHFESGFLSLLKRAFYRNGQEKRSGRGTI